MSRETITENKRKRLERNERIKTRYQQELQAGGMKSAIINGICKSYRMTPPTVYSIINIYKSEDK